MGTHLMDTRSAKQYGLKALLRASQVISTVQLCEGPRISEGWTSLQCLPDRARAGPESEAKEIPLKPLVPLVRL